MSHDGQAYAMARRRLIQTHATLQNVFDLLVRNTRTVVLHPELQPSVHRPRSDAHLAATPLEGVVQHVAQQLHEIAFVATKFRTGLDVAGYAYRLVTIDLGQGVDQPLQHRRHRECGAQHAAPRGGGMLELVGDDLIHTLDLLANSMLQYGRLLSRSQSAAQYRERCLEAVR